MTSLLPLLLYIITKQICLYYFYITFLFFVKPYTAIAYDTLYEPLVLNNVDYAPYGCQKKPLPIQFYCLLSDKFMFYLIGKDIPKPKVLSVKGPFHEQSSISGIWQTSPVHFDF